MLTLNLVHTLALGALVLALGYAIRRAVPVLARYNLPAPLELWALSALPLLAVLAVQVLLIGALCCWPVFPMMGRDYDAAVMTGGFYGFLMGTTANAMANMDALARRYGPAARAFLVVPMVGAFFIDFANALLLQVCLNLFA